MANRVCPVCGNPEIGDYRHKHLACDRCGSDLGIFKIIAEEKSQSKTSAWRLLLGFLCVLIIALFTSYRIGARKSQTIISEKERIISCQANEISNLKNDIASLNSDIAKSSSPQSDGFVYTVRQGDSFCGISRKFYGTEKYCENIAADNGISITSHLAIGQQLQIKSR